MGKKSRELTTKERTEIDAFFALPRRVLYIGLLVALVVLAGGLAVAWVLRMYGLDHFILPLVPAVAFGITFLLARSPEGRGCLLELGMGPRVGKRFAPRVQLTIWGILVIIASALAILNHGRWS